MSWWWEQITSSAGCGLLAGLTWALMVWMADVLAVKGWGWLQGMGILALANGILWLVLGLLQPGLILWVILFLGINGFAGYLLIQSPLIEISPLWSMGLHPIGICGLVTLLGGSLDRL